MPFSLFLPSFVLASVGLAALLTPLMRRTAIRAGAVDRPTGGRKIHRVSTALWGGAVTGIVLIVGTLALMPFADGKELRPLQLVGFAIAIAVLMLGGMLDDRFDLPPWVQFPFPLAAALIVIATGSGIIQVTNPFASGALSLVWWRASFGPLVLSLPSDIITILWLLTVTYAMKFLDGLDGLVAGMTAIGAALIAVLASSETYFQPLVAGLALFVAGAHVGILRWNKQGGIFLGEAGSTIAGFSLGVLSVISGAKIATAATALAIPLVDIVIVVGGRLIAGRSPFKGDSTHLHFRLLQAGLAPRTAVRLMWGLALMFGLIALTLQTRGKLFLLAGLVVLICLISAISWGASIRKKTARIHA